MFAGKQQVLRFAQDDNLICAIRVVGERLSFAR
jgi:hypothetical protein